MTRPILAAESVTELGAEVNGAVLVAGSHGGIIAACLGAEAGAHAMILNDAGVGLDNAGIAGLAWLDAIGMAAATVSCLSARIGDGKDSLARGVISHCNRAAAGAGLVIGMAARRAVLLLREAPQPHSKPLPYMEGRWRLGMRGEAELWVLDSVGKLVAEDDGKILLIGSHGGLHGGRTGSALNVHGRPVAARAAAFNDAGGGIDDAGFTRLPELDARGIAAVTVSASSARIGDGRSMFATGIVSRCNQAAQRSGTGVGMSLREWVDSL
jgi:hypothetical protein